MPVWEPHRYSVIDNRTGQKIEDDDPERGFIVLMLKDQCTPAGLAGYITKARSMGLHEYAKSLEPLLSASVHHPQNKLPD